MAVQRTFYNTDGVTRTYPSTKHIATKEHVAVYLKDRVSGDWTLAQIELYKLVNNSIIFDEAVDTVVYSEIEVRVADTSDELADSPTDISIVASYINNVRTVSADIDNVNTVAENISDVNTVSSNMTDVNTVAANISDVNDVSDEITNVSKVGLNIDAVKAIGENIDAVIAGGSVLGYNLNVDKPSQIIKGSLALSGTDINTTDVIMGYADGKDGNGLRNSTITIGSTTIQTGVDVTYAPGENYLFG